MMLLSHRAAQGMRVYTSGRTQVHVLQLLNVQIIRNIQLFKYNFKYSNIRFKGNIEYTSLLVYSENNTIMMTIHNYEYNYSHYFNL